MRNLTLTEEVLALRIIKMQNEDAIHFAETQAQPLETERKYMQDDSRVMYKMTRNKLFYLIECVSDNLAYHAKHAK